MVVVGEEGDEERGKNAVKEISSLESEIKTGQGVV